MGREATSQSIFSKFWVAARVWRQMCRGFQAAVNGPRAIRSEGLRASFWPAASRAARSVFQSRGKKMGTHTRKRMKKGPGWARYIYCKPTKGRQSNANGWGWFCFAIFNATKHDGCKQSGGAGWIREGVVMEEFGRPRVRWPSELRKKKQVVVRETLSFTKELSPEKGSSAQVWSLRFEPHRRRAPERLFIASGWPLNSWWRMGFPYARGGSEPTAIKRYQQSWNIMKPLHPQLVRGRSRAALKPILRWSGHDGAGGHVPWWPPGWHFLGWISMWAVLNWMNPLIWCFVASSGLYLGFAGWHLSHLEECHRISVSKLKGHSFNLINIVCYPHAPLTGAQLDLYSGVLTVVFFLCWGHVPRFPMTFRPSARHCSRWSQKKRHNWHLQRTRVMLNFAVLTWPRCCFTKNPILGNHFCIFLIIFVSSFFSWCFFFYFSIDLFTAICYCMLLPFHVCLYKWYRPAHDIIIHNILYFWCIDMIWCIYIYIYMTQCPWPALPPPRMVKGLYSTIR